MAPPWVLLDRIVWFQFGVATKTDDHRPKRAKTLDESWAALPADLEAMKPDPQALAPPEITQLSMLNFAYHDRIHGGVISSTDKSLVALYAGNYTPGNPASCHPSNGCYLVYDASDGSLSAIPQLPDPYSFHGLGCGAAILSLGGKGSYVLAELVRSRSEFRKTDIFLWRSPVSASPNQAEAGQWLRRSLRLPSDLLNWDRHPSFSIDKTFSYAGSSVCWVDLLSGAIICNLLAPEPKLTFVPLPSGCSIDYPIRIRPRPHEFRTMGCVRGAIKFATLDGFYGSTPDDAGDIVLRTWTLSPDLREWREDAAAALRVGDLWDSESFRDSGLPRLTPTTPVLSVDEDDVLCFVMTDYDSVENVDHWGQVSWQLVHKARYMLRVDTARNKVLSTISTCNRSVWPELLASEFSAYLQEGSKDHQEQQKTDTEGSKHVLRSPRLKTKLKKQKLIIKRARKVWLRNGAPWGMKRLWGYWHWIKYLDTSKKRKKSNNVAQNTAD